MKDGWLPARTAHAASAAQVSLTGATVFLERLPPEAILTVINLVADVVRADKLLQGRQEGFAQQIAQLREVHVDRKERLTMLAQLLQSVELPEAAQLRLIESICRIAEGAA